MNQSQQQILVTSIAELINRYAPKIRNFRINFNSPLSPRWKCAALAEYIKRERGTVSLIQPKILSKALDKDPAWNAFSAPNKVMPLTSGEDVGVQPSSSDHVIHHPGK